MRVIFVNRYFYPDQSATSRMIASVAFALVARGYEVQVIASREIHNQRGRALPTNETISGVRIRRLGATRFGRQTLLGRSVDYLFFHLLAFIWLLRRTSSSDIVVVCTDPPMLSTTIALALRLRKVLMINWIMDLFPETALELRLLGRWQRLGELAVNLRNWSLKTPGITVCPTQRMLEHLQGSGLSHPMTVMHHWSDGAQIQPVAPENNTLRTHWGLKDKFVVGYSGNFGRAHEFGTIIETAKLLRLHSDIKFLMIGGGHQLASVMEAARKFNLENMIFRPLQPAESLAESLSAADVHLVSLLPELEHCIIPSKFYGILAAGRPTIYIGDSNGEVPRVLASSKCGRSVSIGASEAFAELILKLRNNPTECAQMGQRARQLLVTEYSRDQAIDRWAALVTQLARPSPSFSAAIERSYP